MKTKTPNNESGSALLLTLGILSLALIVAMAFAFSARTNRQIAKVNADQVKARLLAKSALNRVIAAMKMYYEGTDFVYPPEFANFLTSGNAYQKYFASQAESEPDEDLEGEDDSTYDLSGNSHILPVLEQFSTLPSVSYQTITVDGETVGRVAFLVLEEANKLDVNQMLSLSGKIPFVKAGQDRLASFTESDLTGVFSYDISAGKDPVSEENTFRLGLQMQELRVASDYFTQLPSGYNGTKAKWFSYTHLWRKLWSSNAEDALRYTFFSGEDIEAYWDGSTERQRFDITGYEWGGWDVDYKNNLVKKMVRPDDDDPETEDIDESEFQRPEFYEDDSHTSLKATPGINDQGFGIPYLNSLGDIGKQIAANMVDFCDGDSFATTDGTWDGTPPTYCGNEKVPYINEMYLEFSLIEEDGKYQLKLKPSLEMVNIFSEDVPEGKVRIRISGKVKFGNTEADWSYAIEEYTIDSHGELSYAVYDLDEQAVAESSDENEASVTLEKMLIITGASTNNNEIYDVAYWQKQMKEDPTDPTDPEELIPFTVTLENTAELPKIISLEVSDPRCNHRSDCWEVGATGSLGKNNSNFSANFQPEPDDDQDTQDWESGVSFNKGSDSTFSTAFIPNRPFRNFWELGSIHRGEPFRTLDIAGEDAGLLDQIKIGPLKRTYGKFNANSRNLLAWQEFLRGINPQDGYDSITYFDPEEEFITITPSGDFSPSRAAIAAALAEYGANDREREALIGRTANLLTTRMDKYSVLVIGQALKKLDGVTDSNWIDIKRSVVNPVEYEDGYYSILATQRILAHIVRDAWRNEYKIVQLQLLED